MDQAQIEFFGSLSFFVKGQTLKTVNLKDHPQLKDAIESQGVPHCEVDLVTVNGRPANLDQKLKHSDLVQVYPIDQTARVETASRFLVDCNLGKLNSLLRSLGFDSYYENDISDERALEIALKEDRVLLTKDRRLLMRKNLKRGYFVRSVMPNDQIQEVLNRYSLRPFIRLLSRCIDCNVETEKIEKEIILDRLEPLTKRYYDEFNICPKCQKIFWRGSHYQKIRQWHAQLLVGD